jgi:hypothetical protein
MALQSPFFNNNSAKREDTYPRGGVSPNAAAQANAQANAAAAAARPLQPVQ